MRMDSARLLRLVLAGAIGGLVIFFVFNPGLVRDEQRLTRIMTGEIMDIDEMMRALKDLQKFLTTPDPYGAFMFTGAFAAMIGGLLVIVDELSTSLKRVLPRIVLAAVCGIVIGGSIGVTIDFIGTRLNRVSLLFAAIAPVFLWPLMGLAAGMAVGVTLGSWKRARLAMIGGLLGGAVGGMAFQAINSVFGMISGTGSFGRALGFTAMGAVVGASLGFVEEMGKRSWLTVLNGAKEGRQYVLTKPMTTLGRDELADIPLFGDMGVAKNHAGVVLQGYMVTLQSGGGEVEVNGVSVQSAVLQPWDTISIGKHTLRFHQKGDQRMSPYAQQSGQPYAQPYTPQATYAAPSPTVVGPAFRPATGSLALVVTAGPHTNQGYQFGPGTVRIGREMDCGILLAMDTVVSRHHAEVTWNGTGWVIRDLGSRNGLWVNGVRVTEHVLSVGDQIGVGQSWLRVERL